MDKLFIFMIMFLLLIENVFALITMDIDIRQLFAENESISFNYSIISDEDQEVAYIVNVDCLGTPKRLLNLQRIRLQKDVYFRGEYSDEFLSFGTGPQECTAILSLLEPEEITAKKAFLRISELSFLLKIKLDKKVYLKDEDIFLDYESSVENPLITATLTYPDGTTNQVSVPGSIRTEQIGTYELSVTASKEGYKTVSLNEQFGVIEKDAEIGTINFLEEDSVQKIPESTINDKEEIPASPLSNTDSPPQIQEEPISPVKEKYFYIFIGIIAAIVVILLIILFIINIKKR
jgi:hypothetical protein